MKYIWLLSAVIVMLVGAVYLSKVLTYIEEHKYVQRAIFAGLVLLLIVLIILRNS